MALHREGPFGSRALLLNPCLGVLLRELCVFVMLLLCLSRQEKRREGWRLCRRRPQRLGPAGPCAEPPKQGGRWVLRALSGAGLLLAIPGASCCSPQEDAFRELRCHTCCLRGFKTPRGTEGSLAAEDRAEQDTEPRAGTALIRREPRGAGQSCVGPRGTRGRCLSAGCEPRARCLPRSQGCVNIRLSLSG